MKKSFQKFLASLLAFIFILSTGAPALAAADLDIPEEKQSEAEQFSSENSYADLVEQFKAEDISGQELSTSLEEQLVDPDYAGPTIQKTREESQNLSEDEYLTEEELGKTEDSRIRVIVVLENDAIIDTATEQGVKISELEASEVENQLENLTNEQEEVKNQLEEEGVELSATGGENDAPADASYTGVINGFSAYVASSDIETILQNPNVKDVIPTMEYQRPVEPDQDTSTQMVGAPIANELGYAGQGQVVAVIDSGIDGSHPDLQKLSEDTVPALTEDGVNSLIASGEITGEYINEKIAFAYNYYDQSSLEQDIGTDGQHGQHVAGSVAANGRLKGVAPEAQVLGMKVFSDDILYATTWSDIYLEAIDDAILLGADAINMSLGSPAGFYTEGSAEDLAIKKALNNGILVTISAGNENNITEGAGNYYSRLTYPYGLPQSKNPDIGVVGSPSLNEASFSIASAENTHTMSQELKYTVDGEEKSAAVNIASGSPDPVALLGGPVEVVHVGAGSEKPGTAADWEGVDVRGKIALVQRGNTFTDTLANAEAAGAAGLVVYNHANGGEALVSMAGGDQASIAYAFIGHSAGVEMAAAENATIEFTNNMMQIVNPNGGLMSDFSSWGSTPDLRMKPELTAPGGQIYSTQNAGEYTTMQGTSMAAPHAAGGVAVVKQRIEEDSLFEDLSLTEKERAELTKTLMMNTATTLYDEYNSPYLVRKQGAGLMNLPAAVTTEQYVVNAATGQPKIELKDFESKNFSVSLDVTNLSNQAASYTVETEMLKDYVLAQDGTEFSLISSDYVDESVSGDTEFTVGPGETKTISLSVDFSADNISRNSFVEGYIRLLPTEDTRPVLSVPVLGFYGNWDEPRVVDEPFYNLDDEDPTNNPEFKYTTMAQLDNGTFYFTATEKDEVTYISPGGSGAKGNALFLGTMLRNTNEINLSIVDENGATLRSLAQYNNVRKITRMGLGQPPYTAFTRGAWDGYLDGQPLEDGEKVYYEIEFIRDTKRGSKPQYLTYPIVGDSTGPVIRDVLVDDETGQLSFESYDHVSGVDYFTVFRLDIFLFYLAELLTGQPMIIPEEGFDVLIGGSAENGYVEDLMGQEGKTQYSTDISGLYDPENEGIGLLLAYDKAGNLSLELFSIGQTTDALAQSIHVEDPVVSPVYRNSVYVGGQAEAYSTVEVYAEDQETLLGSAVTKETGYFRVNIAPQAPGSVLYVRATSINGGKSNYVETTVLDEDAAENIAKFTGSLDGQVIRNGQEPAGFDFSQIKINIMDSVGNTVVSSDFYNYPIGAGQSMQKAVFDLDPGTYTLGVSGVPAGYRFVGNTANNRLSFDHDPNGGQLVELVFETIPEKELSETYQAQIVIESPDLTVPYNTNTVQFKGKTFGRDDIQKLTVSTPDGSFSQELTLTKVEKDSVVLSDAEVHYGDVYYFDEEVTLPGDDYYQMLFTVTYGTGLEDDPETEEDESIDEFTITRRFWVDTTPPEFLEVKTNLRRVDDPEVTVNLELADNMGELTLNRDDEFIGSYSILDAGYDQMNIRQSVTDIVPLVRGMNEITYTLTDIAGNETTHVLNIEYVDKELLDDLTDLAESVEFPSQALIDFIDAARKVLRNENATQEEVDTLVGNIQAELEKLNATALQPMITGLRDMTVTVGAELDLRANVYATDAFGKDLTKRIQASPETVDTSVPGQTEVTYTVEDDYGNVTSKTRLITVEEVPVTKARLEGMLIAAKAIDTSIYTPITAQNLADTITAGEEVLANPDATQEEVDAAEEAIRLAIEALVLHADKIDLANFITEAEVVLQDPQLSEESRTAIQEALNIAQEVYDDPNATQVQVDEATFALSEAIVNAVYNADKSTLQGLVEEAQTRITEGQIPESSLANVQAALDAAQTVLDKPDASQEEVNQAAENLSQALADAAAQSLEEAEEPVQVEVDKTSLEEIIAQAEAIDTEAYTEESVAALNQAVEAGKAVLNDPEATEAQVQEAVVAIEVAMSALEEKGGFVEEPDPITDPGLPDPEPIDPEPVDPVDPEDPVDTEPSPKTYITTTSIYVRPAKNSSESLGILPEGTMIEAVEDGAWLRFEYNGQVAYIAKALTTEASEEDLANLEEKNTYITTSSLYVRPAKNSTESLGVLPEGSVIEAVEDGAWLRFEYKGQEAYIAKAFTEQTSDDATSSENTLLRGYTTSAIYVRPAKNSSQSLGIIGKNEPVTGKLEGAWFRFTYEGQTAYIAASYVSILGPVSELDRVVATSNLYIRPAKNSTESLGILIKGDEIVGIQEGAWFRFVYNGQEAFVASKFLEKR